MKSKITEILTRIQELIEGGMDLRTITKLLNKEGLVVKGRKRWTSKGVRAFAAANGVPTPRLKAGNPVPARVVDLRAKYPQHTILLLPEAVQVISELRDAGATWKEVADTLTKKKYLHSQWLRPNDLWTATNAQHFFTRNRKRKVRALSKSKSRGRTKNNIATNANHDTKHQSLVVVNFNDTTGGRKIYGTVKRINNKWADVSFSYQGPMNEHTYNFLQLLGLLPTPPKD